MTNYSRTSKYKELRQRLQNEPEEDFSSRDLKQYEKRLNQISATNFEAPEDYVIEDHDPIHARRKQYLEGAEYPEGFTSKQEESLEIPLSNQAVKKKDYIGGSFNNEYLDEYINEVKQYNIEQGNAFSTNTDFNILKSLKGEKPTPIKPFHEPEKVETTLNTSLRADDVIGLNQSALAANNPKPQVNETADVPAFSNTQVSDFHEFALDEEPTSSNTMTKEDIAMEVQNLIREQNRPLPQVSTERTRERSLDSHFEAEATARQQLLNETTQMRAQLDTYEDNLTEVSDKMRHTNQILNIVLIVLIIVLFVVLAVVIYWILTARGA
ncbi:MAG: hypothetical protein J6D29_08130 [Solobacterium sp.]|nr:hypothetical protein [Solobacterium sp.]